MGASGVEYRVFRSKFVPVIFDSRRNIGNNGIF